MATISEFSAAVNQICSERGINPEDVYGALETAIVAAYKREYAGGETLKAEVNRDTGEIKLIADKLVTKDVTDKDTQISLVDARKIEKNLKEDDHVELEIPIEGFGRIATQTARQVILQKMRESEKEAVVSEFREKIGTVVTGLVQRMMGPTAVVEIGRGTAHLPPDEQIPNEYYKIGERYKFLLKEIKNEEELIVSRAAPEFLIELFKLEVPEMESGIVEVKAIAREAGSRSKVGVVSHQEGVDPIGSCVGQRGMRIANVMSEVGDEKIDIIEWAENLDQFIANALGPARVERVEIVEEGLARVHVVDDQLSLAIGKDGQNVRLAAKLTNVKIDITAPGLDESRRAGPKAEGKGDDFRGKNVTNELPDRTVSALKTAGIELKNLATMNSKEIANVKGIGKVALEQIKEYITRAGVEKEEAKESKKSEESKTKSKVEIKKTVKKKAKTVAVKEGKNVIAKKGTKDAKPKKSIKKKSAGKKN